MREWHYSNPVDIFFRPEEIKRLKEFIDGSVVLITTQGTTRRGVTQKIRRQLGAALKLVLDDVTPNPTVETVWSAYARIQKTDYDFIIALGGGSALDTAKGVATLEALGSLEVFTGILKNGRRFPKYFRPKPIIAVPTTAGTGSEVTMWGSIWDMTEKKKYSISHPALYPRTALLDPELTLSLPAYVTAYSGLDALSHAMEAIWNKNHNPVSDTLALEAVRLTRNCLPQVYRNPNDMELRETMLRASLLAGLAFSNTQTALAHSLSYPLTTHFKMPHGLACSLPLPHLMRFNGKKAPERVGIMAKSLGTKDNYEAMAQAINHLFDALNIKRYLSGYGIDSIEKDLILKSAFTPGRAHNNVVELNHQELSDIIGFL